MKLKPRTASPGDICILLEPLESERAQLRERQEALKARFSGVVHPNVHFTVQRFILPTTASLHSLVSALQLTLADFPAFPLVAEGLKSVSHSFWESCLLRWRIRSTEPLEEFLRLLQLTLSAQGVEAHFPLQAGYRPQLVTALEGVVGCERRLTCEPHYLFTASRVVFSEIRGRGDFKILSVIRL